MLSPCFKIYISARCAFVQRYYEITLHECMLFSIMDIGLNICFIVNSFASVSAPPSACSTVLCCLGDCLCLDLLTSYWPFITGYVDMLASVGEGAAVVARSTVWWSVDGCRSTHTTTTRDATSTTAADNRRHRTLVFRETQHSREVTGRRRPAGDESYE